jgi:hypothetical protein
VLLVVGVVLFALVLRAAYGKEPDPFNETQVRRQRGSQAYLGITGGMVLLQLCRLVLAVRRG